MNKNMNINDTQKAQQIIRTLATIKRTNTKIEIKNITELEYYLNDMKLVEA